MKKTTVICTQEYNLSEFRETGNPGIKHYGQKYQVHQELSQPQ